ncbi:MAG: hypothetical protein ACI9EF_001972 [Pseudohongiellaceae bacterium]|jgi:hypothetical protein
MMSWLQHALLCRDVPSAWLACHGGSSAAGLQPRFSIDDTTHADDSDPRPCESFPVTTTPLARLSRWSIVLLMAALHAAPLATTLSAQAAPPQPPRFEGLPPLPSTLCAPTWAATFGTEPGAGDPVYTPPTISCAAVFDDGLGDGPVLYVGGRFETLGGLPSFRFGRWNGSDWTTTPIPNFTPSDMVVHDDGSGPALFVCGGDTFSGGGLDLNHVGKWDGVSWTPLGTGTDDDVWALASFPVTALINELALGGQFSVAGGVPAENIASWDGTALTPLGDGLNNTVNSLEVFPPGPLARLHAGGTFTASGTTPLNRLASWNGSWNDVGGGVSGWVFALKSWFTGGTWKLFAGGSMSSVGTGVGLVAVDGIASWDGAAWSDLDSVTANVVQVRAMEVYDDGGGEDLYIAGSFIDIGLGNHNCARWDGFAWSALGTGVGGTVSDLVVYDDGSGASLYFTGQFYGAGDKACKAIARWDDTDWQPLATGISGLDIDALCVSTVSGSPALYMGGYFKAPDLTGSDNIVGWSDGTWIDMGSMAGEAWTMAEHDDGSGLALYVGGTLAIIDGVPYGQIARWDGSAWSDVAGGMDSTVYDLAEFDDGSGTALYATGKFLTAGGVACDRIAKWDGSSWSPVGAGLGSGFGSSGNALHVWDDGTGAALYATGNFSIANGGPGDGIAKWDGSSWSPLNSGLFVGGGKSMVAWNDGTGEKLYVGGTFNSADGVFGTKEIAAWDGSAWHALDIGLSNWVNSLAVFDDGTGEALFAGGAFTGTSFSGPFVPMDHVGRWDGTAWSALGAGVNSEVKALQLFDDGLGDGPRLAVGGRFTAVPDSIGAGNASTIAFWGNCWGVNNWIDIGFALPGGGGLPLLVGNGSLAFGSVNTVNLSNAAPSAMAGLFMGFSFMPTPFAGGILVPVPFLTPVIVSTSPTGTIPQSFVMPGGLPSAVALLVQWVIVDGGAISGYAISNCVVGTTP